ncbi:vanadium-dependent haloperoxidase [Adhaeribacter rhizoryzae]|uniref:Vanadium-dependent haloperoxidase n=1 Tax=Adhaeribacter rhizoryzae TaxID=2607907 RepID=A0A5M6DGD4_9BACT|nr:vanadium-dependent haloperoxidase [Adhaeribacter rhizoryzae]KAA5546561.1 vanadium-dependent haloperoxidase [Adhaeribacter rhizoryzae]
MKKLIPFLLIMLFFACKPGKPEADIKFNSEHISQIISEMTDLMINDVTNPPLAARFFSYACLAGYEVVSQNDSTYSSMHGVLNKYPRIEKPQGLVGYNYQLSALLAMMETAKKMQPSGSLLEKYQQQFLDSCRQEGFSEEVMANSLTYAQAISKNILAYAKADKYNRISNYPRYAPTNQEDHWYPTPPGFFAPVEPYFNTVRSFTLDTCIQFKPAPPVAFSKDKNSAFYKLLHDVYQEGANLPKAHQEIAAFWDCNPFALQDNGHLMVGTKKISPGAHWLGITAIACKQAKTDFPKAMKINTLVAISLMDGFLACWDEKFRSNRIRPETAIRRYIDPNWKPLLQTPPFPEYLSGHSTISAAAAVILTHYFGDNFKYTDTVEERFGLPARKFNSFQEAAIEAGISRFYGGIHFMDAIDNGRAQGLQIGEWVLSKAAQKPPVIAATSKTE